MPWQCRWCSYEQDGEWKELCPGCGGPYRALRVGAGDSSDKKARATFATASDRKVEYVSTGIDGVDYVLGGGLVAGSSILFGGFRGTGKTRLLIMLADKLSRRRKVVYASSEQTEDAVLQIAADLGAKSDNVVVLGGQRTIEDTLDRVRAERPFLTVYDALQKYISKMSGGSLGSATQGTAVANAIADDSRSSGRCSMIVNQMARSGEFKGGADVEHEVETVMVFAYPKDDDEEAPGDENNGIRMLFVDKNRNGPENLKSYWEMTNQGVLVHVPARSKIADISSAKKYRKRGED